MTYSSPFLFLLYPSPIRSRTSNTCSGSVSCAIDIVTAEDSPLLILTYCGFFPHNQQTCSRQYSHFLVPSLRDPFRSILTTIHQDPIQTLLPLAISTWVSFILAIGSIIGFLTRFKHTATIHSVLTFLSLE